MIDGHVHLLGTGAGGTGCWLRRRRSHRALEHVMLGEIGLRVADLDGDFDRRYVERLLELMRGAGLSRIVALAQEIVYDEDGSFEQKLNPETLVWERVSTAYWEKRLRRLVETHVTNTQSRFAERLLNDWSRVLPRFWHVVPKEMVPLLEHPLTTDSDVARA